MNLHEPNPSPSPSPLLEIPTLSADHVLASVPEAIGLALEARAAEKRALMALSDELVQNLRPEIERLTTELVQRTLVDVWKKRDQIYQNP